jgi:hypothetical protein
MNKPTKILHIDGRWEVTYILIKEGVSVKSPLPLEWAVKMLKTQVFDLIVSEPQDLAVFMPFTETKEEIARYSNQWIHKIISLLGSSNN